MTTPLNDNDLAALLLARTGVLVSRIPEKSGVGLLGEAIPGLTIFRRLDRRGLLIEAEEEPIDIGGGESFTFTPSFEITEAGEAALKAAGY